MMPLRACVGGAAGAGCSQDGQTDSVALAFEHNREAPAHLLRSSVGSLTQATANPNPAPLPLTPWRPPAPPTAHWRHAERGTRRAGRVGAARDGVCRLGRRRPPAAPPGAHICRRLKCRCNTQRAPQRPAQAVQQPGGARGRCAAAADAAGAPLVEGKSAAPLTTAHVESIGMAALPTSLALPCSSIPGVWLLRWWQRQ